MKIALIVLGALAGLVVVIAIVGAMLPRDHVASMSTTIAAPPDTVWAALTDVSAYPTWRTDLKGIEVVKQAPLTWKEIGAQGPMTLAVETFEPPRRMIARIQDQDQPFGGAWEYVIAPDGAGTRVTITERGWVSNPIFRFVSRYVMGHYSTIDAYLRALSRKFGGETTPTRAA